MASKSQSNTPSWITQGDRKDIKRVDDIPVSYAGRPGQQLYIKYFRGAGGI